METVNKFIGQTQMKKVGTIQVAALNKRQDVYLAKLNNGTVDKVGVIAMVDHDPRALSFNILSQLNWDSLHVRSYNGEKAFYSAMKKVASESDIAAIPTQSIQGVDWGNQQDVELEAINVTSSSSSYKVGSGGGSGNLPFKVTLHSVHSDNKFGSELEKFIELIPALGTYNFTLKK